MGRRRGRGRSCSLTPQHTESMESLNRKKLTISVPLLLKHTSMFPSGDEWIKSIRLLQNKYIKEHGKNTLLFKSQEALEPSPGKHSVT